MCHSTGDNEGERRGGGGIRTVEDFIDKPRVHTDALKKWHRVTGRRAGWGREDTVRSGACETARDKFKPCGRDALACVYLSH